jgi:hypothetical protein
MLDYTDEAILELERALAIKPPARKRVAPGKAR